MARRSKYGKTPIVGWIRMLDGSGFRMRKRLRDGTYFIQTIHPGHKNWDPVSIEATDNETLAYVIFHLAIGKSLRGEL